MKKRSSKVGVEWIERVKTEPELEASKTMTRLHAYSDLSKTKHGAHYSGKAAREISKTIRHTLTGERIKAPQHHCTSAIRNRT